MSPFEPSLSDLGISKKDSSRWQTIAELSEIELDGHIEKIKTSKADITQSKFIDLREHQSPARAPTHRLGTDQTAYKVQLIMTYTVKFQDEIIEVDTQVDDAEIQAEVDADWEEFKLAEAALDRLGLTEADVLAHEQAVLEGLCDRNSIDTIQGWLDEIRAYQQYPVTMACYREQQLACTGDVDTPTQLVAGLTSVERYQRGIADGYFDDPAPEFDQDPHYQSGWLEGVAQRERAMATGHVPTLQGKPAPLYWSERDEF